MKFLLILVLTINIFAESQKLEFKSTYGITTKGNLFSKFKDSKVVLKSWLNNLAHLHNGELDVEYYNGGQLLFDAFKNNKFDMIAIDLPFYFKNRKEIENISNNKWSLSINEKKYTQYYLLGNKSKKLEGFGDLNKRIISLKDNEHPSEIWLNKNSLEKNKKSSKKLLKKIIYEKKETTAALNVFFGKSDYAIVSKEAWDVIIEFNPSIKNKIEILDKSKDIFLPFIGFFSNKASDKSKEIFFVLSDDLSKVAGGDQIVEIMKFNSIYKLTDESLSELDKYYNEYFELKKKYK